MPRIFVVLVTVTIVIFGAMFYQYNQQIKDESQLKAYQTVLYDKSEQLFKQAKDWSKPINLTIQDHHLKGDYKVMADFELEHMLQNAEARNQYLRDLKAQHWDKFLDIERLSKDKKDDYAETEKMLKNVHDIVANYQKSTEQREVESLEQAKKLPIKARFRQQLAENIRATMQSDDAHAIFELEQQSLAKADEIFVVLKNNKWEKKNRVFLFYEDAPLKKFNALYAQMVELNVQMEQVKTQNRHALEKKL